MPTPRIVELRQNVLKKNDLLARELRGRFREAGVYVVSLVSSPGAGKTTLLRETLLRLRERHRVAALVGDLATENDARQLGESGAPARQITTGTVCHLEAEMVERALEGWDLAQLDLLFIENVGNLVCPASYDLGEDLRVLLFSVTEGEDKPAKYPTIVLGADLVLLTKGDLADAVGFDRQRFHAALQEVRPDVPVLEVSARTGEGLDAWLARLEEGVRAKQGATVAVPGGGVDGGGGNAW
ncbi:hydrogenase accessory protein HypB [Thermus scotoductus]|uniref:Hydrogenase accessory protein HypB n=1 Tax=Thermus scotoductus TaxID=37636 RepID=A0A430SG32_THESC|nr:hydrogenase accessory protein HypB [Thermus scotoductus]